jgi:hypothetical protein
MYLTPENYEALRMRLFCHTHASVHEFAIEDVELIVYALTARIPDAYGLAEDDAEAAVELAGDGLPCPLAVLRETDEGEVYSEQVLETVMKRAAANTVDVIRVDAS